MRASPRNRNAFPLASMVLLCFMIVLSLSTSANAVVFRREQEETDGHGSDFVRAAVHMLGQKRAVQTVTVTRIASVTRTVTMDATATVTTVVTVAPSTTTSTSTTVAPTPTAVPTAIVLTSNDPSYGQTEVMADLESLVTWAGAQKMVTAAQKTEIVAAILSGAARYYPEMPTKAICRIMLGDIRTESDFNVTAMNGDGRLDSGSNWGLLQVSPGGSSQQLALFRQHANVATHNFTYGMPDDVRAGIRGPLLDYATGLQLDLASLTTADLYRPWINIHLAMWVQTNLARTQSQDPYYWTAINDYSWGIKTGVYDSTKAAVNQTMKTLLVGSNVTTTIRTGLGSWVAGPASSEGGYTTSGDDVSTAYLNTIMRSVRYLYGESSAAAQPRAWLETYTLNAGLVDYI